MTSFKHAQLKLHPPFAYTGLAHRVGESSDPTCNPIAAGDDYIAFLEESCRSVGLVSVADAGKRVEGRVPCIRGGGGTVNCISWHPAQDGHLATADSDSVVRIWRVPCVLEGDITEPVLSLSNSSDNGQEIAFHPSAPAIVGTRGLKELQVYDLNRPDAPIIQLPSSLTAGGDNLSSLSWSFFGDVLLTATKTGGLSMLDPRKPEGEVSVTVAHGKGGATRAIWANASTSIITTGASTAPTREREMAVWDSRALSIPLKRHRIGGVASGFLIPMLDFGSNLLFLCGRGDSNVRVFDFSTNTTGKGDAASLTQLTAAAAGPGATLGLGSPARGVCLLPRRKCALAEAEVARVLKLVEGGIQAVRVLVPRRDQSRFADELYPPIPAPDPSIAAHEWFAGADFVPLSVHVEPPTLVSHYASASMPPLPPSQQEQQQVPSMVEREISSDSATPSSETSDAQATTLSSSSPPLRKWVPVATVGAQKFRHTFGSVPVGVNSTAVTNLKPLLTTIDSQLMAASTSMFAVPWATGGGGAVYVGPLGSVTRVPAHCTALLTGHKSPVRAIDFSPFYPTILATASEDGTVFIWQVPPEGLKTAMGESDALTVLSQNTHSCRIVLWHPQADGLLMTAAVDSTVRLFDVRSGEQVACYDIPSPVHSAAFDRLGTRLALAGKDGKLRILDVRTGTISLTSPDGVGGGARQMCCFWRACEGGEELLATTGAGIGGQRCLFVWDPRSIDTTPPLHTLVIDRAAGALLPTVCTATGLLLLASRGDTTLRLVELCGGTSGEAGADTLSVGHPAVVSEFRGSSPLAGGTLVPPAPHTLDVPGVEIARYLRLTADSALEEVRFVLPRSDELKQYFQDNLYMQIAHPSPSVGAADWWTGIDGAGWTASLQPQGMELLSNKPVVVNTGHISRTDEVRAEAERLAELEHRRKAELDRLGQLAKDTSNFTHNDCMGPPPGEEDDW